MNGILGTYGCYQPFPLRYRRVNGTFCDFIKVGLPKVELLQFERIISIPLDRVNGKGE